MKPRIEDEDDIWLSAVQVRELFGGISAMTLNRWLHREFPRPTKIMGRNFFSRREILAWRASQSDDAATR